LNISAQLCLVFQIFGALREVLYLLNGIQGTESAQHHLQEISGI